jgi:ribosomal protein S12 methylthiotransferase
VQRKISSAMNKKLVGQEFTLLVEGPSPETDLLWEGRLQTQAPEIDGVCYINDFGPSGEAPVPGQFRRFRVTEATDYDLVGELLDVGAKINMPTANPFTILNLTTNRPTAQHI